MKVSRKIVVSVVNYGLTTIVGFIGTLYFANVLGPGPLGTFALGMTLVKWLELTDLGTGGALVKRVSEMEEEGAFLSASIVIRGVLVGITALTLFVFKSQINDYIGGQYALLVTLLFLIISLYSFVGRGLLGINKGHLKTSMVAVERVLRVIFQASLVIVGFHTIGLYVGYFSSLLIATAMAGVILIRSGLRPSVPERRHFRSIYEYAKFNLLTRIRNRSFSWIDILILGYFVTNESVGIYQVTWNVALTFWLASNAISTNLFPEISNLSANNETEKIRRLLSDGLAYAGVVPIPGLIGATLVGRGVLKLYGPEFVVATDLLVAVSVMALIKSYEQQILTALNSLDHPEYSFRVNLVFVASNISLNILLIPEFELLGAAAATGISVFVSLIYSWYFLRSIISVSFPAKEIANQLVAATVMGVGVIILKQIISTSNMVPLLFVVFAGGVVYFGLLLVLSEKFRMLTFDILRSIR